MMMDAGMDTGEIVLQETLAIEPGEKYCDAARSSRPYRCRTSRDALELAANGRASASSAKRRAERHGADSQRRSRQSTGRGNHDASSNTVRAFSP